MLTEGGGRGLKNWHKNTDVINDSFLRQNAKIKNALHSCLFESLPYSLVCNCIEFPPPTILILSVATLRVLLVKLEGDEFYH